MADESLVPNILHFGQASHSQNRPIGHLRRPTHLPPLPVENESPVQVSRNHARVDKKTGKVKKPGLTVSIQQPEQNSQQGRDISTDHLGTTEKAPYEEHSLANNSQLQRTAILQKINNKHLGVKTAVSGSKDMGTQISAQKNPSRSDRQSLNSSVGRNEPNFNKHQISEEPASKTNKPASTKTNALGPIKGSGSRRQVKGKNNSLASSKSLSSSEPSIQQIQGSNAKIPVSDKARPSAIPPIRKKQQVAQKIPTGVQDKVTQETVTLEVSINDSSSNNHSDISRNNRSDRPGTVTIRKALDQPSKPSGNKPKTNLHQPNSSAKKATAEPSKSSSMKPEVTQNLADSNDKSLNQSHPHKPESASPKNSLCEPPKSSRKKSKATQNASSSAGLPKTGSQNCPAEQASAPSSKISNKPPASEPEAVEMAASTSTTEDPAGKISENPSDSTSKMKHQNLTSKFKSKLPRLLRSAERSAAKAERQSETVSVSAPGSGKKPRRSAIPVWVGYSQCQGNTDSISSVEGAENEVAGLPADPSTQRFIDGISQTEQDQDSNVYGPGMRLEDVQGGSQILVSYEKLEEIYRAVDANLDNLHELYQIGEELFSIEGQIRRERVRVITQTHILESRNRRIYIDDEGCKIN